MIDKRLATEWIENAGRIALRFFLQTSSRQKADGSLVTEADKAVEDYLVNSIRTQYPHHGIVSEEGTRIPGEEATWIIDPIDGTQAYVIGLPTWCISIGILYERQPVHGIVYLPMTREMVVSWQEKEVIWNDQKIHVPENPRVGADSILCVSMRAHQAYDFAFPGQILALGSGIIHSCLVARGAAIGALMLNPRIWDLAAVYPILQNAGADVYQVDGKPWHWENMMKDDYHPCPLIACHPRIKKHLQSAMVSKGESIVPSEPLE